jgi:hypothetical protein
MAFFVWYRRTAWRDVALDISSLVYSINVGHRF